MNNSNNECVEIGHVRVYTKSILKAAKVAAHPDTLNKVSGTIDGTEWVNLGVARTLEADAEEEQERELALPEPTRESAVLTGNTDYAWDRSEAAICVFYAPTVSRLSICYTSRPEARLQQILGDLRHPYTARKLELDPNEVAGIPAQIAQLTRGKYDAHGGARAKERIVEEMTQAGFRRFGRSFWFEVEEKDLDDVMAICNAVAGER